MIKDMEIDVLETSSMKVVDAVAEGHFVLGIIRCHAEDQDYFLLYLEEKGLQYETLWESAYAALIRKDHPLSGQAQLSAGDIAPYMRLPSAMTRFRISATAWNHPETPSGCWFMIGQCSLICSAVIPLPTCGFLRCPVRFCRATTCSRKR